MYENFCDKDHYIFTEERCNQLPLDIIIFILFEIFIANQARQSWLLFWELQIKASSD